MFKGPTGAVKHHCLVRRYHRPELKGIVKSGMGIGEDHREFSPLHQRHLPTEIQIQGQKNFKSHFTSQYKDYSQSLYQGSAPRSRGPTQRGSGGVSALRQSYYRTRTIESVCTFLPHTQIHKTIFNVRTFFAHGIISFYIVFTLHFTFCSHYISL